MQNDTVIQLKRLIADDLDVNLKLEEIDEAAPLFEQGLALDSIVLVELVGLVERHFGFEFDDGDLNVETFKNLRSLAEVVDAARQQVA